MGPAVVLLGIALWQPPLRGTLMLAGLAVALSVCAFAWPLPDWTWLALYVAGSIARAGARELTSLVVRKGLSVSLLGTIVAGLLLASWVLPLDPPGAASVQLTYTGVVLPLLVAISWVGMRYVWRSAEAFDANAGAGPTVGQALLTTVNEAQRHRRRLRRPRP